MARLATTLPVTRQVQHVPHRQSLSCRRCYGSIVDRTSSLLCHGSSNDIQHISSAGGVEEVAATFVDHICSLDTPSVIVSLGTGEIVSAFLEKVASSEFRTQRDRVKFFPTSMAVASECSLLGLALSQSSQDDAVHIHVDQADELHVDGDRVYYIVGRGENGPQVGQPDIPCIQAAAQGAKEFIIFTEEANFDLRLSGMLPVVIEGGEEEEWEECAEEVDDMFLGDAEVMRRSHSVEANTRGYPDPVITKDGHMILDLFFYSDLRLFGESVDYETFQSTLMNIPGVVSSGLVAVPSSAETITIVSKP